MKMACIEDGEEDGPGKTMENDKEDVWAVSPLEVRERLGCGY
jgi:hypothetical protein